MRITKPVFILAHIITPYLACMKYAGQLRAGWAYVFAPAAFVWVWLILECVVVIIVKESQATALPHFHDCELQER